MGDNVTALLPHRLICDLFTKWRTDEGASFSVCGRNPITILVQYHCKLADEIRNNKYYRQPIMIPTRRYQFDVNLADPEALIKVERKFIWLQGFAAGLVDAEKLVKPKVWD